MFEIGKTYHIKNIDVLCNGEMTILNKVDEQGTTWDCRLKLYVDPFALVTTKTINSEMHPLAFLLQRNGNYWETDEGYLQLWFTKGGVRPQVFMYKQPNYAVDILVADYVTMKFVDNLDLVERLSEKLNKESVPPRN